MVVQQRASRTRQKLIGEAARLFVDHGYHNTTPRDIAKAAGLTPGAFYYHFDSKEDLATAIVDQGWPNVGQALERHLGTAHSGLESAINAVFTLVDIVNRDKMQWIGFHLNTAIGHFGPDTRKAYRKRVETFSELIADALLDSEIRDGMTRRESAELIWIAMTGAQLMSDALEETGPALFDRLGMAWKSALHTIVPDEALPRFQTLVDDTAARYWRANGAEPL